MESTMNCTPVVPAPAVPAIADGTIGNVIDQATANLIARVNAVLITGEELMLAAAEVQKLPLQTCNREARTRRLALMFEGRRGKASVVNLRLEAMAQLIRADKIPSCWVRPAIVRDSVFLAAATEPLLLTGKNEPFFDPESFVAFLLEGAEIDGHA
jgi:hypothetical protein